MSPAVLAAFLVFATLVTSFVSGLIGMAGGIILMGMMLPFLPVAHTMVLHGFVQLVSNGWRAWIWRRYIKWPLLWQSVIGTLLALALFMLLRFMPSKRLVYLVLGLVPFVQYLIPQHLRLDVTKRGQGIACGFIVTLIQLMSGVAGSVLNQFYVYTALDRREQVATKAICQSFSHISKLIYFGGVVVSGDMTGDLPLLIYPALAAAAMAGNSLAAKPLEKLSNAQFKVWSERIILGLGLYYLAKAASLYL